jgi:hypothetical protein
VLWGRARDTEAHLNCRPHSASREAMYLTVIGGQWRWKSRVDFPNANAAPCCGGEAGVSRFDGAPVGHNCNRNFKFNCNWPPPLLPLPLLRRRPTSAVDNGGDGGGGGRWSR